MSQVPAGLTANRTLIFRANRAAVNFGDDRAAVNFGDDRAAVNSGGKLNGEIFSKLGSCGREFFDSVGGQAADAVPCYPESAA
ncbi:MAG: hypothetical protein DMG34_20535 [Acidobacteria bacterium]|nr:MAG: hypothetical protein DMG34_20535 [Acidobacteriota bacterium]